jgi:hypothetical protein
MSAAIDFGLTPADFWSEPLRTRDATIDRVADEDFVGLVLAAPAAVPYDARETLPAVVLHATTLAEADGVLFNNAAVAVAVNVATRDVHAATFTEPLVIDEPPAPRAAPSSEGFSYAMYAADLRARLGLAWQPAEYLVTVLVRDRVSNRVRVALTSAAYDDPAVRELIAQRRAALPQPGVWPPPGRGLPSYRPASASPPVPAEPGVALVATRVVVLGEGQPAAVHGSYRLPVERRFLGGPARDLVELYGEYTAVVPVTLVLTATTLAGPYVLQLRLPSYAGVEAPAGDGGAEVTGHFALDLLAFDAVPQESQTWFLYAFAGEFMTGPVPIAFVEESELPYRRGT